jgi:sugar phosphate isomerase/epimerase
MKLGVGTYCYMWSIGVGDLRPTRPLTALGLLQKARELGVHLVQMGPNLPLDALPEAELVEFIERAREWQIEIELATRGLETDHLRAQLALCQRLDARLLRTIAELGGKSASPAEVVSHLRAILPDLERAGVKLGLENHGAPAAELAWALDQLRSPHLGVVLDTVNSLQVSEGYKEVARILAPYTISLHAKEFYAERIWTMMGFVIGGKPVGQGQLDAPWLLQMLKSAGAVFNVIIELWPPQLGAPDESAALEQDWVRQSVAYLRQYVKE